MLTNINKVYIKYKIYWNYQNYKIILLYILTNNNKVYIKFKNYLKLLKSLKLLKL